MPRRACWAREYTCACAVDTNVTVAPPQRLGLEPGLEHFLEQGGKSSS